MLSKVLAAGIVVTMGILAVEVAAPDLSGGTAAAQQFKKTGQAPARTVNRPAVQQRTKAPSAPRRDLTVKRNQTHTVTKQTKTITRQPDKVIRATKTPTKQPDKVIRTTTTPTKQPDKVIRTNKPTIPATVTTNPVNTPTTVRTGIGTTTPNVVPRVGTTTPNVVPRVGTPTVTLRSGPGPVIRPNIGGPRPAIAPVVTLRNRPFPVVTGPKRVWWGGGWRTYVPLAALGAVTVGTASYYAHSYVSAARPYCDGVSPDGCQMRWQSVNFEGGGSDYQCVQYCPQQAMMAPRAQPAMMAPQAQPAMAPPSARPGSMAPGPGAMAAPPPAAPTARQCDLVVFAEPAFAGVSAPSDEDQPNLGEVGWKNQIASIQVKSGTWDFFSEDEFQGENMRLPPGQYAELPPEWTRKVGSFMCVE